LRFCYANSAGAAEVTLATPYESCYQRRKGRTLRTEFAGAISRLTNRGNARQKVFFSDADRKLFLSTLAGVGGRYGWICNVYYLMGNQYRLLIETPKANLSIGCTSSTKHTPTY
jgi:hypothetical protein